MPLFGSLLAAADADHLSGSSDELLGELGFTASRRASGRNVNVTHASFLDPSYAAPVILPTKRVGSDGAMAILAGPSGRPVRGAVHNRASLTAFLAGDPDNPDFSCPTCACET